MRVRTQRITAIGTALGIVLMASAITPAAAIGTGNTAPAAVINPSSCSAFAGGTATGSSFAATGVTLRAGDKITATVAPNRSEDVIFLSASAGLNIILAEGPTTGFTFQAPATAVYNLQWSYRTASTVPTGLTWSFSASCSSTTVSPAPSPSPTATTKPGKRGGRGK